MATVSLGDLTGGRSNKLLDSSLPFNETESCTASKQEHIVSVNLRELSMYLLKHGTRTSVKHVQGSCTPLHVHAMATRHVAAQLETSRALCQMLCRASSVDPRLEQERGFILVYVLTKLMQLFKRTTPTYIFSDQLDEVRRWLLFVLLERYRCAIEGIAFPAPQGFTSFFTYLGYRALKYSMFLQYVQRSVFELQVDVSKIIMAGKDIKKVSLLTAYVISFCITAFLLQILVTQKRTLFGNWPCCPCYQDRELRDFWTSGCTQWASWYELASTLPTFCLAKCARIVAEHRNTEIIITVTISD